MRAQTLVKKLTAVKRQSNIKTRWSRALWEQKLLVGGGRSWEKLHRGRDAELSFNEGWPSMQVGEEEKGHFSQREL